MANWTKCVIDAAMSDDNGFCFCPVNEDGSIVTGMNYIQNLPPEGMELIGVIHDAGHEAAQAFINRYASQISAMKAIEKVKEEESDAGTI